MLLCLYVCLSVCMSILLLCLYFSPSTFSSFDLQFSFEVVNESTNYIACINQSHLSSAPTLLFKNFLGLAFITPC